MKFAFITFFLFRFSLLFAQQNGLEFAIYFGNDFNNDSVTIIANGVSIAKNIKLKETMISPQNLIIIQTGQNITVSPHYEQKQILDKIPIKNSILRLNISINNVWKTYRFNLKEGRFFYPKYKAVSDEESNATELLITQSKQGPIMF